MKTFVADIFPKIQRYSQKLDNLTLLTNQHWVSIDNLTAKKTIYIFRNNNELLISMNGKVEKAKWEYLGNKSLLIDKATESYLFKHGFFDENILALKVDSSDEYAIFVNENKYDGDLNSIDKVFDFLKEKYIDPNLKPHVETVTGHKFENKYTPEPIPKKTAEELELERIEGEKNSRELNKWVLIFFIGIILLTFILYLSSR
jgi:hypothetical protein